MKKRYMRLYSSRKTIRIFLCICLSSFIVTALAGFRDFKEKGVEWKFRARIVDIEKPPPDQKVLVVKEITITKAKIKGKKIYVLVTEETIIGVENKIMKIDDLHVEMGIEVQGLKVIEKDDKEENTLVLAKRIRPLIE